MKNWTYKWSKARGYNWLCSNDATCHCLLLSFISSFLSLPPSSSVQQISPESILCAWNSSRGWGHNQLRQRGLHLHSWSNGSLPDTRQHAGQHGDVIKQVWERDEHTCLKKEKRNRDGLRGPAHGAQISSRNFAFVTRKRKLFPRIIFKVHRKN